jgi:aminopeptidase C
LNVLFMVSTISLRLWCIRGKYADGPYRKSRRIPFIHNEIGGEILTYLSVHTYVLQKDSKNYFGKYLF